MVPSGPPRVRGGRQRDQQIPVTHLKRKHSPQAQRLPVVSRRRPKQKETLNDEDKGAYKLYLSLATSGINDEQWGKTVCRSREKFFEAIQIMPQKKQTTLMSLYDAAREHWTCAKCEEHTIDKFLTRFLECAGCGNKYHRGCVSIDQLTVRQDDEDETYCEECLSASDTVDGTCRSP